MLDVDPSARRSEDFYPTPSFMTRALRRRVQLTWAGARLVEPCCGDGAIVRELPAGLDVLTNDIVIRPPAIPEFTLDARQGTTWDAFRLTGRLSVCVTNPPFDQAFDIAAQALEAVDVGLILLLRLSWLEPTEERGPWLQLHPPTRLIVMPRHDFRGNGKTDSVSAAWLIWDKCGGGLCRPGVEVVTKRERDELARESAA